MRATLVISCALHLAVLLWAVAEFPRAREFAVAETTPLPVDIVSPEEFTKIKAGTRDGEAASPATAPEPKEKPAEAKKETPRPPPTRTASTPPPPAAPKPTEPAPEPARPDEPEVVQAAEEPRAEEPKPEPVKAEGPPPPAPRKRPPPPRTALKPVDPPKPATPAPTPAQPVRQAEFNPDRIAALLNKVPDAGPQTPSVAAAPEPQAAPEPARGDSRGQDMAMSVNEIDALRARISQCWIPPVGGMGADAIQVRLRMQLNPDGTLRQQPDVMNHVASPFFQAAADSAVRAVWQCQPYDLLPAAKYALWQDMILNFDPREMFGG